jgi:hypothetical protein
MGKQPTKRGPELSVEIGPRGVRRIVVETARGDQAAGNAILAKILPAVDDINKACVGEAHR